MASSDLSFQELLTRARWQASRVAPYFAKGLWAMTFVAEPDVATCAVDAHWRVYFNPDYAKKCAAEGTLVGEVLHELLHPTLRHKSRGECIHAEHAPWNVAGDKEIDCHIDRMRDAKNAAIKLVKDRVMCKPGEEHWTAEEHYAKQDPKEKSHCQGGSGSGSGAGAWEKGAPGSTPDTPPGLSEAEVDVLRAQIAQDVKKHEAKHRGTVPAGILRWAEEFGAPPPIDYGALVTARVRYAIDMKRGPSPSYARPSRRQFGAMILPVHRMPIARVALVLDTSGSMSDAGEDSDIAKCIATVHGACEALGRVLAIPCDAKAEEPVEVRHVEDLRPFMTGGGGTDMCVGIARAEQEMPDVIVVVTDGGTSWPSEAPSVPVVVVLTQPSEAPEWAEVILMN